MELLSILTDVTDKLFLTFIYKLPILVSFTWKDKCFVGDVAGVEGWGIGGGPKRGYLYAEADWGVCSVGH